MDDFFNDALGNAFLRNQLGHLTNFLPNLQNWHNNLLLNNAFGISSVHLTRSLLPSESNPSGDIFTLSRVLKNVDISLIIFFSLTIELRDFLLVVTFARDDPTRLVLHGTSDVDRPLLLLELLHFCLKIHRLHLIARDRCELASHFSNFSSSGSRPFLQLRETRHLWLSVHALVFLSNHLTPSFLVDCVESLMSFSASAALAEDLLSSSSCPCLRHPSLFHHASW